jgi:hypothetical protein
MSKLVIRRFSAILRPILAVPCLCLAIASAGPASAAPGNGRVTEPPAEPAPPAPEKKGMSINDFLSDDETRMLFDYLRDAFIATVRDDDEEVSMPPELAFKLAILRQRMLREGDAAARLLMQAMQQEMDRAIREYQRLQTPAPPVPYPPEPPARP